MYHAVAVDLDQTLLRSDCSISPFTYSIMSKMQQEGIALIVCTGRSYAEAMYALGDAPVHEQMVVLTGAQIAQCPSGLVLQKRTLPIEVALHAMKCLETLHNGIYLIYSGEYLYFLPSMKNRIKLMGMAPKDAEMTLKMAVFQPDLLQKIQQGQLICEKIFIIGQTNEEIQEVRHRMEGCVDAQIVSVSGARLEIMPRGTSKAAGLRYVLAKRNIQPENIVAFGDSENDISMLKLAGLPIAMENAQQAIKCYAKIVAPCNDADGVALTLRWLMSEKLLINAQNE